MSEANWAGNYRYEAGDLHRPSRLEQVQELVVKAPRVRVLGSRHSFTDIADSSELLSLDGLPADVVVDHAAGTVSVSAALRYGELAEALNRDPHRGRRPALDEPAVRAGHGRHPLHLETRTGRRRARAHRGRGRAGPVRRAPALGQAVPRRGRGHRPPYERLPDFTRLVDRLDPRGAFRNSWLSTRVLGRQ